MLGWVSQGLIRLLCRGGEEHRLFVVIFSHSIMAVVTKLMKCSNGKRDFEQRESCLMLISVPRVSWAWIEIARTSHPRGSNIRHTCLLCTERSSAGNLWITFWANSTVS